MWDCILGVEVCSAKKCTTPANEKTKPPATEKTKL